MYTAALLALAPIAAQAAQSARWPVYNLRANVTEQYIGYGNPDYDRRQFWHNAPVGVLGSGDISGPLFENDCGQQRAGLNDHAPYSQPNFFYPRSTSAGQYAPSELVTGGKKIKIAQKNQRDANGRRAVVTSTCGAGSTSIYISDTTPHHLTYDNKEAKGEKFGSFYLCGGGNKGDDYGYGDALFYRSADEVTPEECGEVIFYPECMPLHYVEHNTQGTYTADIDDGSKVEGHYDAWCYVDVKDLTGAPNEDISTWFSAPRTSFDFIGKIKV